MSFTKKWSVTVLAPAALALLLSASPTRAQQTGDTPPKTSTPKKRRPTPQGQQQVSNLEQQLNAVVLQQSQNSAQQLTLTIALQQSSSAQQASVSDLLQQLFTVQQQMNALDQQTQQLQSLQQQLNAAQQQPLGALPTLQVGALQQQAGAAAQQVDSQRRQLANFQQQIRLALLSLGS
jgi:hypothetical protein